MPATNARVLPSRPAAGDQQRGGRRLLRSPQVERGRQPGQREDEDEVPPAGHQQRVRVGAVDTNGHLGGAVPHDVVRDLLSRLRARQAAQPVGEAMSGDLVTTSPVCSPGPSTELGTSTTTPSVR